MISEMFPSAETVRRAAARNRRSEAEAKKKGKAVAGAEPKAKKTTKRPEARHAVAKKIERAAGEKLLRAAEGQPAEETESIREGRKRPRSLSPTVLAPPTQRPRSAPESPTILISDTSLPEPSHEVIPPMAQEEGPSEPVADSVSQRVSSAEVEAEADAPQVGPMPEEVQPPPETEEGTSSFSFRSILDNGRWAERLMSQVCTPELQRGMRSQGTSSFFRDAFAAHLWAVNSLAALKEVLSQAEAALGQSNEEAETAQSQIERAEKALEEAKVAEARERTRADEAAKELEKALEERAAEHARAEELLQWLDEAQNRAAHELDNARAAEQQQRLLEAEVSSYQRRLQLAAAQLQGAEERAENAEEIARRSDARVTELGEAVRAAEEREAAAELSAAKAVENFRRSADYEKDLAASTAFAYDLGFQDCKAKVSRIFGSSEVGDLEPDEAPEEPAEQPSDISPPAEP